MFWETLWALVLGFGLSGAVQAFVSRAGMRRALGDHRPATIARAAFFGAISSSCSYAASALAKTLFVRGADFTAAQAFMFASTNLVVELGIVLWLLIGWQFAAAEFVGGAIMIALLAIVLPRVVRPAPAGAGQGAASRAGGRTPAAVGESPRADAPDDVLAARSGIRTLAGWADAASYTISDLTMLRKELVVGFVVAGFADVAVPVSFWQSLFLTGHGFWSDLENVVLGPFLAIISFVCSIGNVPLAAALWAGGISFGGTIAFVFADLITLPLLLIYRKFYGTALTVRLLAVFWATMSAAGLITEYLFRAAGIAPAPGRAGAPGTIGRDVWAWNYTTVLDIAAIGAFAVLYWLYRSRERLGAGDCYAKDPVCGMQVQVAHAPARASRGRRSLLLLLRSLRAPVRERPGQVRGRRRSAETAGTTRPPRRVPPSRRAGPTGAAEPTEATGSPGPGRPPCPGTAADQSLPPVTSPSYRDSSPDAGPGLGRYATAGSGEAVRRREPIRAMTARAVVTAMIAVTTSQPAALPGWIWLARKASPQTIVAPVPTSIAAAIAAAAPAPIRHVLGLNSVAATILLIAWVDPAMPARPSRNQSSATVSRPVVAELAVR